MILNQARGKSDKNLKRLVPLINPDSSDNLRILVTLSKDNLNVKRGRKILCITKETNIMTTQ